MIHLTWPDAVAVVSCVLIICSVLIKVTRRAPYDHSKEFRARVEAGYRPAQPSGWEVDPFSAAKSKVKDFPVQGRCPVEICRIKTPHSHTEALIRRIREQ